MKINVDRLCELAGLNKDRRSLNEASNRSMHEDPALRDEAEYRYGKGQLSEISDVEEENEEEDANEMIEVDEAMLVQELRRMKSIMSESKRRQNLQEAELKAIIDQEVKNVLRDLDMNLNSKWIYGKRKPRNVKRGYVNTAFPGIGFK